MRKILGLVVLFILIPVPIFAYEKITVELEMKDGVFNPRVIKVPSETVIRIKITNTGTEPSEFESTQLRKEKVLVPNASSVVVIAPLKSGTYTFFDDFHPSHPKGEIIAME
ncbi:hypothetical protein CKC_01655 [Candidatus Liberibacter solanacearum CLso-ZC1]|uniref:EfeO-type cupredoxin-like domain-containing protein n=1 Tax=Liberibacter solanacearum (strain CLso-ZC1) TaxID=658172 RepID=E4UCJ2_LIBSC|nr:cupredoxin domain-containing protein [Candidatus Liberibacter solanacearum]ADR52082.1 hypothetical protein CKC_01655 [Candidatus Liberibacter solanacearum CLso-ZC1]